jgi:hypothetical protein
MPREGPSIGKKHRMGWGGLKLGLLVRAIAGRRVQTLQRREAEAKQGYVGVVVTLLTPDHGGPTTAVRSGARMPWDIGGQYEGSPMLNDAMLVVGCRELALGASATAHCHGSCSESVDLVLALDLELRLECADLCLVGEDRLARQLEEAVQEDCPVGHLHQDAALRAILGQLEVRGAPDAGGESHRGLRDGDGGNPALHAGLHRSPNTFA